MDAKVYTLILSDDSLFCAKFKGLLESHQVSSEWKSLVFSSNIDDRDFTYSKLFKFIIRARQASLVILFDFESKDDFLFDTLKILSKYNGAKDIIKVGIIGTTTTQLHSQKYLKAGCHLLEYKKPDLFDLITNIELLRNEGFDGLAKYATAPGAGYCLWANIVGSVNKIDKETLVVDLGIKKIDPSKNWIESFVPDLTDQSYAISNDSSIDRKFRWIDDVNTLKYSYRNQELLCCDSLNVKSFENGEYTFDKRNPKQGYGAALSELRSDKVRVLVFDDEVRLMQEVHHSNKQDYDLYSYPFIMQDANNTKRVQPHIILIQWDRLTVLDDEHKSVDLSNDQKAQALKSYIQDNSSSDTVFIICGTKNEEVPQFDSRQLNIPFEMTISFLNKMVGIYNGKVEIAESRIRGESICDQDFELFDISRDIAVELPIVVQSLSEYSITFTAPTEIADRTVLRIDLPVPYYVLVLKRFNDKEIYFGLIIGVREDDQARLRMQVNSLLRIPVDEELTKERAEFFNLNTSMMIKKEKLRRKEEAMEKLPLVE